MIVVILRSVESRARWVDVNAVILPEGDHVFVVSFGREVEARGRHVRVILVILLIALILGRHDHLTVLVKCEP